MPIELTEKQIAALEAVKKGADVYSYSLARTLRALDQEHPGLVHIGNPRMYKGDGTDVVPYFGAITSEAGKKLLV